VLQSKVLVREMLDVGGLERNCLFGVSFMVCHGRFFAWSNFVCEAFALREGLLWLGSMTPHYRRKNFLSLLTLLLITV